jgi:hypothetical protein
MERYEYELAPSNKFTGVAITGPNISEVARNSRSREFGSGNSQQDTFATMQRLK